MAIFLSPTITVPKRESLLVSIFLSTILPSDFSRTHSVLSGLKRFFFEMTAYGSAAPRTSGGMTITESSRAVAHGTDILFIMASYPDGI